jgi:4-alpha-glucanotransferase
MTFERASGILLHPSSLPGDYGIGELGTQAYRFLDWLGGSGCKVWQILPLGPTGYGDSPYQCFSSFAGNPYLISLEELIHQGFLHPADMDGGPVFKADRVNYGQLIPWKSNLLKLAFERFHKSDVQNRSAFDYFCATHVGWLEDFALFMAIKEKYGGGSWEDWPEELKFRREPDLSSMKEGLVEEIQRFSFYQYIFYDQWNRLRQYANTLGIRIIGDLPIFTAMDSADVWSNPELFLLDENLKPTVVSGVPPDVFSRTGQLWGNPLYNWEVHKQSGYKWWAERLRSSLRLVDVLRLDHFRGFAGYWEIPAENLTAEHGRWVAGPGIDLFNSLDTNLGDGMLTPGIGLPIIAEDLGVITPDVIELRERFHLPGMKILQFGFNGADNPFLPHHYPRDCVAYTGTHDNNTAMGWLATAPAEEKEFALRYLGCASDDFAWELIRCIWSSVAVFAITPMQDILSLGGEARMNYPSQLGGNWQWRMTGQEPLQHIAHKIHELNVLFSR